MNDQYYNDYEDFRIPLDHPEQDAAIRVLCIIIGTITALLLL